MVEPSQELQVVFDKAVNDAKKLQHEYVTLEHLLFAMLCVENFENVIKGYGVDPELVKKPLELFLKTKCKTQSRCGAFPLGGGSASLASTTGPGVCFATCAAMCGKLSQKHGARESGTKVRKSK